MKDSTRSTLHFLMVLLGICVLLAGVALWFGFHEYDHHYEFEGEYDSYPEDWGRDASLVPGVGHDEQYADYESLGDRNRRIVDSAVEGRSYVYESPREVPPTLVERDGTFYAFNYYRTFDWSAPGTFGPALVAIAGLWVAFEGIRREQFGHVPVYRNLYRRLTKPFRRLGR